MAGQSVAQRGGSNLPALAQPALEITSEDVALPRLYIGQHMSTAVQEGHVKPGSVFTALGEDDADPNVVWEQNSKKDGVLFHVLGLKKGKSFSEDGNLQRWDFGDPEAPPEAWTTYQYFVALPEVDKELPYKFLLTRTGTPAAKQINLILKKNEAKGPSWTIPFRLTAAPRKNEKGSFFVAQVRQVTAKPAQIKAAEALAVLVSGQGAEAQSTGDQPQI